MNTPTLRTPPRQVPTLTQVLEVPVAGAARTQREATGLVDSLPVAGAAAGQARPSMVSPEFEAKVRAQILHDLKIRIDAVIDERLYRDLEPLVTSVMETFSARLQDQVRKTLGEVVAQAVEQALAEERRRQRG